MDVSGPKNNPESTCLYASHVVGGGVELVSRVRGDKEHFTGTMLCILSRGSQIMLYGDDIKALASSLAELVTLIDKYKGEE